VRFLGIGETNDLGDMYLRLIARGHQVRVHMSDADSWGVMEGMLEFTDDWRRELDWIRAAGEEGIILFETASQGSLQDELRSEGYRVIGGSRLGDRLESDRAYGQEILRHVGVRSAVTHDFDNFESALTFVRESPRRYVLKLNGSNWPSSSTYTGQMATGEDMLAMLAMTRDRWPDGEQISFVLMDHIEGVEVGVGAFFNGREFLSPANLDWEHKRFFPGDIGELTGEMGTVVTYRGAERIFDATLGRLTQLLANSGYCGYINLNTIVNDEGVWPLEFTCRFGYPGFPILDSLHIDRWDDLFALMTSRSGTSFRTLDGYSVGVVLTVPPFPYSHGYDELGKGAPISLRQEMSEYDRDSIHYGEVAMRNGQLVTAGMVGYVAVVTGLGATVQEARDNAYRVMNDVVVPNGRYRNDIGKKLIKDDLATLSRLGWLGQ
jgi:phosphoribosylamine---glycine ligase